MTKQSVINFGKSSTHYFLTLLFAAIGTYVGAKVTLAELKKDNEKQDSEIMEIKNHNIIYDKAVWVLQGDLQFVKGYLKINSTRGGINDE